MEHKDKLEFLHKIAKLGVQQFQGGGLVGGLSNALGIGNNFTAGGAPTSQQLQASLNQSNQAIGGLQNIAGLTLPGISTGVGNQNALAAQLMAMTQGQGPNPALNQLAQSTGQNVTNQAALMAAQRGSNQNVGLLARQAAQQGAQAQQQAAGQAATLQAQQQIAAQNNLANLSAQQVGQAGQAAGAYATATGNQLGALESANAAANTTNASVAGQNAASNKGILGSVVGGIAGGLGLSKGGEAKKMATGGQLDMGSVAAPSSGSWVADYLNSGPMSSYQEAPSDDSSLQDNFAAGKKAGSSLVNKLRGPIGGQVGDLGSSDLMSSTIGAMVPTIVANGGQIRQMSNKGDVVKAKSKSEKASKAGNSYSNDKIPAMLSEGEVVIDRATLEDRGPVGQMARAIRAHIESRNKGKK